MRTAKEAREMSNHMDATKQQFAKEKADVEKVKFDKEVVKELDWLRASVEREIDEATTKGEGSVYFCSSQSEERKAASQLLVEELQDKGYKVNFNTKNGQVYVCIRW